MFNKTERAVVVLSLVGASFSPTLAALKPAHASAPPNPTAAMAEMARPVEIDRLISRLAARGLDRGRVEKLLSAPEVSASLSWRIPSKRLESDSVYAKFKSAVHVQMGADFCRRFGRELKQEEQRGGLPAEVQAARFVVESACGANTGRELVLAVLVRQALADSPRNVRENVERLAAESPAMSEAKVRETLRRYAAAGFSQLMSLIRLDEQGLVNASELKGSRSGAFGLAQFMPGTYEIVFKDSPQKPDLFDMKEAIGAASALDRLNGSGQSVGRRGGVAKRGLIYRTLMRYNQSESYAKTIVELGGMIKLAVEEGGNGAQATGRSAGTIP